MLNAINNSNNLASDVKDMGALRQAARERSPEALKETAKQFEGLFMNMIMKSMRDATPQDGMFDSQQTKMYTSMLDQQISQNLAKRGVGLADMLVRQLSTHAIPAAQAEVESAMAEQGNLIKPGVPVFNTRESNRFLSPAHSHVTPLGSQPAAGADAEAVHSSGSRSSHVRAFEDKLSQHAEEASRRTGIPAKFMLGQAALESGWGRREITAADGTTSHNLFGIKASADWKGKTVEIPTTEYVNGAPQTKLQKFRSYDSYAESFQDYARLLSSNPRYEKVIANSQDASSFAQGLQKAGYATDPNYAAKLTRIIKQSLSS